MAFPIIGYRNILRNTGAATTASSTEAGFAAADLHDYKPWKIWKSAVVTSPINIVLDLGVGNEVTADYLAIINHNLTSLGGTVELLDGAASPAADQVVAPFTPDSDNLHVELFTVTSPARRYWRLQLVHSAPPFSSAPFIGEVFLGLRTTLTEYMSPGIDPFMTNVESRTQRSEGGQYLGGTMRGKSHRFQFSFSAAGIARAAYTSDLNTFIDDHLELRRPFVFVLDSADTDFKVPKYLRLTDGGQVTRQAVGGVWSRLGWSFQVQEAFSEPVA